MADPQLASFSTFKISFFFLNVEHLTSERDLESTFTKVKLAQTFSMRYGISDDRNSNFLFTPGRNTEVICRLFLHIGPKIVVIKVNSEMVAFLNTRSTERYTRITRD